MRMQGTFHRQPQARWSMTSHLQELARKHPETNRVLAETERAVPRAGPARGAATKGEAAPPGR